MTATHKPDIRRIPGSKPRAATRIGKPSSQELAGAQSSDTTTTQDEPDRSSSSILGGQQAPQQSSGRDTDALGPSDSSDSGSDIQGERAMATGPDEIDELGAIPVEGDSDSDAAGTGERASAVSEGGADSADIMPDRIIAGDATEGDDAAWSSSDEAASEAVSDLATETDENATDEPGGVESTGENRGETKTRGAD